MVLKGFFVITDISGYTEYLTHSELDHAHEILQSLFEAQLATVKHPFILSGFRGDAIFMYAPETNFIQPQTFLEALENFYIVFRNTLQQMQYNTTCTCRACKNMSMLDLKMCVHYGEYLVQKLADREELLGADVIVPHRMLKNHVIEKTNITSYALFSDVAAKQLNLMDYCENIIRHAEEYDHIGEVPMCIHDLRPVWEREQAKRRSFVSIEDAWVKSEVDLHFPPAVIWEYLTNPALEAGLLHYDYAERTDNLGGRMREDSQYHCAHGDLHVYNKVLDWKPFEYFTVEQTVFGISYLLTRWLIPVNGGTHLAACISRPAENAVDEFHQRLQAAMDQGYAGFESFLEQEVAEGKITTG